MIQHLKKSLLLLALLCIHRVIQAQPVQSDVINNDINYYGATYNQHAGNGANGDSGEDDIVIKAYMETNFGLVHGTTCTYFQCSAPCNPGGQHQHQATEANRPFNAQIRTVLEGWESDANPGEVCTFHNYDNYYASGSSPFVYIAESYPNTANLRGYVLGYSDNYDANYLTAWRFTHGTSWQDPLDFGTLNTSGKTVKDYGSNQEAQSYMDQAYMSRPNVEGQASGDIFYAFTLGAPVPVTISTDFDETNFDTYLELFDAQHNLIALNDDVNGAANRKSTIDIILQPGRYLVRVEGYESNSGRYKFQVKLGQTTSYYHAFTVNDNTFSVDAGFPFQPVCSNDGVRVFYNIPTPDAVQAICDNAAGYFVMPQSNAVQYPVKLTWNTTGGSLQVFTGDLTNGLDPNAGTTYTSFGNCPGAASCLTFYFVPQTLGGSAAHHFAQVMTLVRRDNAGNIEWVACLPIFITGKQGRVAGSTLTPNIPTMVLHDPPGDASYTEMNSEHEVCQGFSVEYAKDETSNLWGTIKLGAEGSVGFIVETDYEVYAQATATMEMGVGTTNGADQQMCYKTASTYTTSADQSQDDIFIGTAIKYLYGFWYNLTYNNNTCQASGGREIMMAPDRSVLPSIFFRSESAIRNIEIPLLNEKILQVCNDPNDPECIASRRQLYVWSQALANNDAIKAAAPPQGNQLLDFDGGGASRHESVTVTSNQQQFIETHVSVETGWALEAGVEIAGSGVSGGGGMKTRVGMGHGANNATTTSNTITYHLQDDDSGDYFAAQLYSDPVYGTPVFKVDPSLNNRSSCPYEGGIQLDNPKLSVTGGGSNATTILGAPGGVASTHIDLINDSPQERTYLVKLNANSNPNGARVSMAGVILNGNDDGQEFTIPANSAFFNQLVEVQQNIGGTVTSFPGLEVFMYPLCEPSIRSSLYITANFATPPANDLLCNATTLPVNGVVQTGFNNIIASTSAAEQMLSPGVNDCITSWCESDGNSIENSVWFKFTAPSSGALSISTCNLSDFDTQLALYSGADCNNPASFSLIAANDDGPLTCATAYDSYMEVMNLTPGATYFLLVDGWNGAVGNFDIVLTPIGASSVQEKPDALVDVQVNPNPNKGVFKVQLKGLETDAIVSISDMLGRVLLEQPVAQHQETLLVNLGHTPPGQYLLSVKSHSIHQMRSFIVGE